MNNTVHQAMVHCIPGKTLDFEEPWKLALCPNVQGTLSNRPGTSKIFRISFFNCFKYQGLKLPLNN